jgi:hypothetical protein
VVKEPDRKMRGERTFSNSPLGIGECNEHTIQRRTKVSALARRYLQAGSEALKAATCAA